MNMPGQRAAFLLPSLSNAYTVWICTGEVDKRSIEATSANTRVTELVIADDTVTLIYRIGVIKTVLDALRESKEIRTSRPGKGEMYGCLKT